MRRKTALPELLSPAGSADALLAALDAGADAVYFGAKSFNARALADNFDSDACVRAIYACHVRGARAYVTLNTLVRDREMTDFLRAGEEIYKAGADAVIVADAGGASLLKKYIPELELHASTQMSVHSTSGVDALVRSLGVSRAVLAREASAEDISSVVESSLAEIEIFLHGALCVCHSGQCLMSSLVGGRSGNRGECAQPCRLPYGGKYPLSLSDLCLAGHIPELLASGVSSLKIEGRMKSPSYVYGVTSIYRRLLDEGRAADDREKSELAAIFSRGGFTDGYFRGDTAKMGGVRSASDKALTRRAAAYIPKSTYPPEAKAPDSRAAFSLPAIPKRSARHVAGEGKKPRFSALFMSGAQLDGMGDAAKRFDRVYLPLHAALRSSLVPDGVYLPPVIFDSEREGVARLLAQAASRGVKYALVGNVGAIALAREASLIPDGDFRLNVTNSASVEYYRSLGVERLIMSPELTLPQMRDIGESAIVYGRIPLMLLERCVTKEAAGCAACGKFALRDRMGVSFPVMREYRHRSLVLNSVPTYMGDKKKLLRDFGVASVHFIFTTESPAECRRVTEKYFSGEPLGCDVRRIAQK